MSRTVLVSNRVANLAAATQAGGVSVALAEVMTSGPALWFGWNGEVIDEDGSTAIVELPFEQSVVATTPLGPNEYRDFYLGYSNSVLWPVFHNRLDLAQFEAGYYSQYRRVNRRFAELLLPRLTADDIIWIHDYQLIPLALELRALGATNAIGFYLHIPAPPAQAYLAIPEHVELAQALGAFDLIGLQTEQDVANLIEIFQQSVRGELLSDGRIKVGDRQIKIASYPIGIDVAGFQVNLANAEERQPRDVIQIIGIDRLDYTKGLPQKFRAYGQFLEDNPEHRTKVVLSQLASPTRETLEAYADIRAELESLAGSINGRFGDFDWAPINYMHRTVDRCQLFDIYRSSRVGLVTPLRDGMNLVAKEYVAAQDPDDPGVLILSRFAGAAEELRDAVIVNPYNIGEVAGAIKQAVEMPLDERRRRHQALFSVVTARTSSDWSRLFLSSLADIAGQALRLHADPHGDKLQHMLQMLKKAQSSTVAA